MNRLRPYLTVIFLLLASATLTAQGFFPLQAGNKWHYDYWVNDPANTHRYWLDASHDSVLPNGKMYYKMWTGYPGFFIRVQGDSLLVYSSVDSAEYVMLRSSAQVADTMSWIPYSGYHAPIIVRSVETQPQERCGRKWYGLRWSISLYDSQSVRSGSGTPFWNWTFQDSLGLIEWSHGLTGEMHGIIGAVLDGVPYGITTGIAPHDPTIIPSTLSIHSYPNPFNPTVTIQITTEQANRPIVLDFYDALGRCIDRLEMLPSNRNQFNVNWTPNDFPSGVYWARITDGQSYAISKLLYLR